MSDSLQLYGLYSSWSSPGQNTGVDSHSLLQGIFPTQGSNPGLPHYRWILYQLSHQGSPRILEWVAYPFSRGSSHPRNRTEVSSLQVESLTAELPRKPGGKEPACQCRKWNRLRFNLWFGKIHWSRYGNPLQYSCLENPMDRGAWWATVHRVTKSRTWRKWEHAGNFFLKVQVPATYCVLPYFLGP